MDSQFFIANIASFATEKHEVPKSCGGKRIETGFLARPAHVVPVTSAVQNARHLREVRFKIRANLVLAGLLCVTLAALLAFLLGDFAIAQKFPLAAVLGAVGVGLLALGLTARSAARHLRAWRKAEASAVQRQILLDKITSMTKDVIYIYDLLNRRHVYLNHSVAEVLGYTPAEILQMGRESVPMIIHPDDRAAVSSAHTRLSTLEDGEMVHSEFRVKTASGETRWLHSRELVFTRDSLGRPLQVLGTASDITWRKEYERQIEEQKAQLSEANKKLEALASTDFLTGLANRRVFMERLELEVSRSRRGREPLSVIAVDVDRFKLYNDDFGHPAGDAVLVKVGELLSGVVRETDLVARLGGEEFGVLLPSTDTPEAQLTAERLRSALESHAWPLRPVTASFGCTTGGESAADLLSAADKALYSAKSKGRNRVECSG